VNSEAKKAYCDTSVFGGVYDSEFQIPSNRFFKQVRCGIFNLIISPVVDAEISDDNTPIEVKKVFKQHLKYAEIASVNQDEILLQSAYLKEKNLTPKWEDDALHVALATIHQCDKIVSWNFKHIVNFKKIPLYNAVNILNGYQSVAIYSPLEVVESDED